jgi:hypothetical protein
MDIKTIVAALRQEHENLTVAIISLERIAAGQGRRRGRPPAWMVAASRQAATKGRGRPPGSKKTAKHENQQ